MRKGSKHKPETIEKLRLARLGKPGHPHKKGVPISKSATVVCVDCGCLITNTTVNRKRCDSCRKENLKSRQAEFRVKHAEKIRKENCEYWKRIRQDESRMEVRRGSGRVYRANNRGYFRKKAKEWRRNNPELKRQRDNNRRAMKHNAVGSHTVVEFFDLCDALGWGCFYCGGKLSKKTASRDHMVPLSRGGYDSIDNIAPSCLHCNQSKSSKTVEEFLSFKELVAA